MLCPQYGAAEYDQALFLPTVCLKRTVHAYYLLTAEMVSLCHNPAPCLSRENVSRLAYSRTPCLFLHASELT